MLLGRNPVGRRHVGERQQLVDAAHRMSGDDLCEHVGEVGLRIDAVLTKLVNLWPASEERLRVKPGK
jgi:hypothetical protein